MIRLVQRIGKAHRIRAAVAFNHNAAQPQENRPIEAARVEPFFEAAQRRQRTQRAQLGQPVAVQLFFNRTADKFDRTFHRFQRDIADKAVRHHHIDPAAENLVAFHVSDKIQRTVFQQTECLLHHFRAFDVFRTDIEQADPCRLLLRVERIEQFAAQHGKLPQLFRAAIHVRAQIQHQR